MELEKKYLFSPIDEFKDLNLSDFLSVVDAFERRIDGWFFEPIEQLLGDNKNLFVITAIECMVVDALGGFWFGKDTTGNVFRDFLVNRMNINPNVAEAFYKRFRNGILHQTNIKKKSVISKQIGDFHIDNSDVLFFNPIGFYDLLGEYFRKYMIELKSRNNCAQNFKKRFKQLFKDEFSDRQWREWESS